MFNIPNPGETDIHLSELCFIHFAASKSEKSTFWIFFACVNFKLRDNHRQNRSEHDVNEKCEVSPELGAVLFDLFV